MASSSPTGKVIVVTEKPASVAPVATLPPYKEGTPTAKPTPASVVNLVLGPTPAVARGEGSLPTPAALTYIASNLQRPSEAELPSF